MKEALWVEKYRPKTVEETILPPRLKESFQAVVKSGELQHTLLSGKPGMGKTTLAKALCNEMGLDYIMINGSDERNIDTLRNKVKQFASSISLQGGYKVVILDEADYLNANSFQPALRAFMEEFSNNCRFIMTCNLKNRIIEPLHGRCAVYDFTFTKKELMTLCGQFLKRCEYVLGEESISFDKKAVADLIMRYAPDWRKVLNELQRTSRSGEVTATTLTTSVSQFSELYDHLKAKDFKKTRQWVVNNIDNDTSAIIRGVYDNMKGRVKNTSIPQLILILADYQYKAAFVADHEVNMMACMVEIMSDVDFE